MKNRDMISVLFALVLPGCFGDCYEPSSVQGEAFSECELILREPSMLCDYKPPDVSMPCRMRENGTVACYVESVDQCLAFLPVELSCQDIEWEGV